MGARSKQIFEDTQRAKELLSLALNSSKPSTFIKNAVAAKSMMQSTEALARTLRSDQERQFSMRFIEAEKAAIAKGIDDVLGALDNVITEEQWHSVCGTDLEPV